MKGIRCHWHGAYIAVRVATSRQYDFAGKVVLITGGSRGLGLVLARQLARDGARLVVYPGLMRTGSPVNVQFKGRRSEEYTWFAIAGAASRSSKILTPMYAAAERNNEL